MRNRDKEEAFPFILGAMAIAAALKFLVPWGQLTPFAPAIVDFVAEWGIIIGVGTVISGLVFVLLADKLNSKSFEPVWIPLDASQVSRTFARFILEESEPAIERGYLPMGTYVSKQRAIGRVETACFLHPQGHSILHIVQIRPVPMPAIEIQSFLDDGSVISSTDITAVPSAVSKLFSQAADHGFLINVCPNVMTKTLMEAHDNYAQAALADPNIGLRKLTAENWREYASYASRRFDQIMFELGKYAEPPRPFTFPRGELVRNEGSHQVKEKSQEAVTT